MVFGKKNNSSKLTPQQLKVRLRRYLPQLLLLGLAVHLLLPQLAPAEQSLEVIRNMKIWALALVFAVQVISYAGSGYILKSCASIVGQSLSIVWGVVITLAASSIGLVAGGMVGNAAATYKWMRSLGISSEGSGLASTLPPIFNNFILVLISVFGLAHLLAVHQLSTSQSLIFLIILLLMGLVIGGIIWSYSHREQFTHIAARVSSRLASLNHISFSQPDAEEAVQRMFKPLDIIRSRGWQGPALGSIINAGFDMLTLYFLFIAVGHPVSPGILLSGYGLPLLFGKMAFLIPGGVGVVEGTMVAMYTGLGVPNPVVVVVILSYRMFSFWLPTLLGFPLAFYLQNSKNRSNREKLF